MESLPSITFFYTLISFSIFLESSTAADTITPTQPLNDGETLVSSGQTFELGFFSPGDSKSRYLGIWYKNSPNTTVWVANRENPIEGSYGVLSIGNDGNLALLNKTKGIIWSSSSSRGAENPTAQLLETGNLVLRDESDVDPEIYTWQSFDFPCDTLLAGMKFGWNLKDGQNRYLTSWRNASDPAPGDFTWRIDIVGLPQMVLRKGSEKMFRSGPWNGLSFNGLPLIKKTFFTSSLVDNADEFYYSYELDDKSIITRLTLDELGIYQRLVLSKTSKKWDIVYPLQDDLCDDYGRCGANSICRINDRPICECLEGFVPKSQEEWEFQNWTSGCIRRTQLDCQKGEGFMELEGVKLPDLLEFWVSKSMTLKECEEECLRNCSCTAYTNSNISEGGSGCLIWFRDLIDIREFHEDNKQNIYIRMPASELELMNGSSQSKKRLVVVVVSSTASGVFILGLVLWFIVRKRKKRGSETEKEDLELQLFDLATISSATNNFSDSNLIGKGGFGPVYKGTLASGQEIAVKRLSNNSGQGFQEFKNEVILIAKLQHRNLVRLLGYCVEEERMLVYEYMPNKSLDCFIFDQERSILLNWPRRFDIVMGVARGLLYLHQDSRLRIIHRDLKTSNILLDSELNPKISDFGIARVFGGQQTEAKTKLVIGTYGYMSPEYAIDGKFSVKSDVFSFGVLLLEIVSSKKNRGFCHPDHHHNLLGHAWLLWNERKTMELMDAGLKDSCIESQVLRCIQVGLLCVQKLPVDRPTMSSIIFMLGNEEATLPQPKQPGFFFERSSEGDDKGCYTENTVTLTILEAR